MPYAADNVNAARKTGMHLSFVTNNASRAPQTVVDKLAANDIVAAPSEVFSAAMDAAAMLNEHVDPGSMVLVVGGEGVRQALLDEGFQVTSSAQDEPVAVVQGWDPAVDWALLSEGVYAINAGALHVATNLDATLPTERGFALGNGSLVAAIVNASGQEPWPGASPSRASTLVLSSGPGVPSRWPSVTVSTPTTSGLEPQGFPGSTCLPVSRARARSSPLRPPSAPASFTPIYAV